MESYKVCVLMATYNGEKYLKQQIDSILNSSCDTKVLVSDDGSTDDTLKIISKYPTELVELICSEKKGSSSKNFLELIKAIPDKFFQDFNFFAFSDQDDLVGKNHYKNSIKTILSQGSSLCGSSTINIDEEGKTIDSINYNYKSTEFCHLTEGLSPGFTYVFTSNLIKEFKYELLSCHGIDVFWHDWLLYSFCIERGLSVAVKDKGDVFYRQHGNNVTGSRRKLSGIIDRLKKIIGSFYALEIVKIAIFTKKFTRKSNIIYRLVFQKISFMEFFNLLLRSRRRIHDRILISYVLIKIALNRKYFKQKFAQYR